MKLYYYDDKKGKCQSHELELQFDPTEVTVFAESKEDAIEQLKKVVENLKTDLDKIDWNSI